MMVTSGVSTTGKWVFPLSHGARFVMGSGVCGFSNKNLHLHHLLWNVFSKTYIRLYIKLSNTNSTKPTKRHSAKESGERVGLYIHCLSVRDTTRPFLGECHANSILKDYLLDVVVGEYSKTKADTPKDVEPTKPTYTQIQQFNVLNQQLNGRQRTNSALLNRGFRAGE